MAVGQHRYCAPIGAALFPQASQNRRIARCSPARAAGEYLMESWNRGFVQRPPDGLPTAHLAKIAMGHSWAFPARLEVIGNGWSIACSKSPSATKPGQNGRGIWVRQRENRRSPRRQGFPNFRAFSSVSPVSFCLHASAQSCWHGWVPALVWYEHRFEWNLL